MFQNIDPHAYHNQYLPRDPEPGDIVLIYEEKDIFMKDEAHFFTVSDLELKDPVYLFAVDDTAFFLSREIPEGALKAPLFSMRTFSPSHLAFAAVTGWQLYRWYEEHRFCGKCGNKTVPHGIERAMVCPSCGKIVYPVIMPAVIAGVINEKDEILVTRYAGRASSHFALVAGFAEIGETIEETVIREVREETALDVYDLHYVSSQPWSFSDTLLFGFFCRADSSQPVKADNQELQLAAWKSREEMSEPEDRISLTAHMIRLWYDHRALPVQ